MIKGGKKKVQKLWTDSSNFGRILVEQVIEQSINNQLH